MFYDTTKIGLNDLNLIRNNILHVRRVLYSKPKISQKTQNSLSTINITTYRDEHFLFFINLVDNIIDFSTDTNMRALCEVNRIFMNDTFKSCPKYFSQLFTIRGLCNGLYVALFFFILPNKTSKTYIKAFQNIICYCSSIQLNFQPPEIFVDFEVAIHTFVKYIWSEAIIRG